MCPRCPGSGGLQSPGRDARGVNAGPADHLPAGPALRGPCHGRPATLCLNPSACELSCASCDCGDRREHSDEHLRPGDHVPPLSATSTLFPLSHTHLLPELAQILGVPSVDAGTGLSGTKVSSLRVVASSAGTPSGAPWRTVANSRPELTQRPRSTWSGHSPPYCCPRAAT